MGKTNIERNHTVIKMVCTIYRKELTIYSSVIGKYYRGIDIEEYINFINDLSLDEFVGNYLIALYDDYTIKLYIRLLEIHDFVRWVEELSIGSNIEKEIKKYLCN